MTAQIESISPTWLIIRYVGSTRAVAGTMMRPSSAANSALRPGKRSLAKAYPASAEIAVAPTPLTTE